MGVFGVWCGKCTKYLAFGTFTIPAVDALRLIFILLRKEFYGGIMYVMYPRKTSKPIFSIRGYLLLNSRKIKFKLNLL